MLHCCSLLLQLLLSARALQLPAWWDGVGPRLVLTPYIEARRYQTAKGLAAVDEGPFNQGIPSYAGFLTVNKQFNSNLFFWFFPAEVDYENAPVLLWLQGGPGTSSLFGLFYEIGPFSIAQDNETLVENPHSWHKNHSVIFIDNPVGTGFSFTDFGTGLASNQTQIGEELYCALVQFFTLFRELRFRPFFIAGESYAGKYVPNLGYIIHKKNPTASLKINLEGIAVGNGWTDPVTMMDLSSFLYHLGLVDHKAREELQQLEEDTVQSIHHGDFQEAYVTTGKIFSRLSSHSYLNSVYNFLEERDDDQKTGMTAFLQRQDVRRALHVGDAEFSAQAAPVYVKLVNDIMQSARGSLEGLLDHYRVLYYSGQLDVIVAYPLSVSMYHNMQFGASELYRNATRTAWYVDGQLAGYMKTAGKFTEVMVRNAGHFVPKDQPAWALDLITRFTRNRLTRRHHYIHRTAAKDVTWL